MKSDTATATAPVAPRSKPSIRKTPSDKPTSALAAIAALATSATAKPTRSGKLSAVDPALDDPIKSFLDASREVDRWDALRGAAEAQIIERGKELRLAECRRARRSESSIRLNGAVTLTQKSQYCKVDAAQIPELETAFGDDAGRYFVQRMKIELTEQAASEEAVLSELLETFGAETFARIFKVTRYVDVTDAFHDDYTLRPEVEQAAAPFFEAQAIRAYKPTVRQ